MNNLGAGASLACLPACCPEFLWMWHLQGSDSLADSLHQSQALWLALHESQLRGGRQGPWWGRQACSPHHSRAMEQSLCARPRASWASVLWSVHIFHLVCAGQGLAYGLSLSLRAGPVEQPCSGGGVNCPRVLAKEHIPPQTTGMDREGTRTHCHSGSSGPEVSLPLLALWPQVTGALRCHRGRPGNGPQDQDEQAETQAAEAPCPGMSWSPAGT